MSAGNPVAEPDKRARMLARAVQILFSLLLQAAILFVAAGRLDWAGAWAYLALYVASIALNALLILPRHPELMAERGRTPEGTKGWDNVLRVVASAAALLALLVAGLDVRFGWSAIPAAAQVVALVVAMAGLGLSSWAMAVNRFFSRVVRIQTDRGHTVVTDGPYRYIRHPGYAGLILHMLGTPILLGSALALLPAGIMVATMIVRTILEDRVLQAELPGYREYAGRTRQRLIPGVW